MEITKEAAISAAERMASLQSDIGTEVKHIFGVAKGASRNKSGAIEQLYKRLKDGLFGRPGEIGHLVALDKFEMSFGPYLDPELVSRFGSLKQNCMMMKEVQKLLSNYYKTAKKEDREEVQEIIPDPIESFGDIEAIIPRMMLPVGGDPHSYTVAYSAKFPVDMDENDIITARSKEEAIAIIVEDILKQVKIDILSVECD